MISMKDLRDQISGLKSANLKKRQGAVAALLNLAWSDDNRLSRSGIIVWEGIEPLVSLLSDVDAEIRHKASYMLEYLASNHWENQERIAEAGGIRSLA